MPLLDILVHENELGQVCVGLRQMERHGLRFVVLAAELVFEYVLLGLVEIARVVL